MSWSGSEIFLIVVSIPVLIWFAKKIGAPPMASNEEKHSEDAAERDLPAAIRQKIDEGRYRHGDLVLLQRFDSAAEAAIIRGLLLDAGIFAVLRDEQMGMMKFNYAEAIGGIKVYVHETELADAQKILSEYAVMDAGVGTEWALRRCPKCGSDLLTYQKYHPAWLLIFIISFLPIIFRAERWVCLSCSHKWKEPKQE